MSRAKSCGVGRRPAFGPEQKPGQNMLRLTGQRCSVTQTKVKKIKSVGSVSFSENNFFNKFPLALCNVLKRFLLREAVEMLLLHALKQDNKIAAAEASHQPGRESELIQRYYCLGVQRFSI